MAEITRGVFSWTNFNDTEETEAGGRTITFLGLLDYPEIPDSDGDIEHTIESRDRLEKLADKYYGEQLLFHAIAVKNNIDLGDIELNPGDKITIPDPIVVRARLVRR